MRSRREPSLNRQEKSCKLNCMWDNLPVPDSLLRNAPSLCLVSRSDPEKADQRVVRPSGITRDPERHVVSEMVAWRDHESVQGEPRVQPHGSPALPESSSGHDIIPPVVGVHPHQRRKDTSFGRTGSDRQETIPSDIHNMKGACSTFSADGPVHQRAPMASASEDQVQPRRQHHPEVHPQPHQQRRPLGPLVELRHQVLEPAALTERIKQASCRGVGLRLLTRLVQDVGPGEVGRHRCLQILARSLGPMAGWTRKPSRLQLVLSISSSRLLEIRSIPLAIPRVLSWIWSSHQPARPPVSKPEPTSLPHEGM